MEKALSRRGFAGEFAGADGSFAGGDGLERFFPCVSRGCQTLGGCGLQADVALRLCLQLRQNPPACSPGVASVVWDLSLLISDRV